MVFMLTPRVLAIVVGCIVVLALAGCGGEPTKDRPEELHGQIWLIGVKTADDFENRRIQTTAPDGSDIRTVLHVDEGTISVGRLSPDGTRLAFSRVVGKGEWELWLLDANGRQELIADQAGPVTAWSPDAKQLAFYRKVDWSGGEAYESLTVDIATKQRSKLALSTDYIAEDWHPRENTRTISYLNPGKHIHQDQPRPNTYFLRQLELLTADGKKIPITNDPSFDNIYSRYSPTGDRIAYYRRRFVDGRPKEFAVVSASDGTSAKEVFAFTDTSEAEKLNWFHPHAFPAWSPDEKTIAWLVTVTDESNPAPDPGFDLVFFPAEGGKMRRISLPGLTWVGAIDWRR
jgi:Tol biopolymer transport system component